MKFNKGMLFVFEGVDGVGKSTLAEMLYSEYKHKKANVSLYSFPGQKNHTLGKLVYDIHNEPKKMLGIVPEPISMQMLHIAAHIDLLVKQIIPDLESGKIVLLDRCWWSTLVYGYSEGIDKKTLISILQPELKIWNTLPVYKYFVIERSSHLFDTNLELKLKLENKYHMMAKLEPLAYVVSNDSQLRDSAQEIVSIIDRIIITNANRITNQKTKNRSLSIVTDRPIPSKMYETFWEFTAKRQSIYMQRATGKSAPWTDDEILRKYKFTNAYRAADRVSQYLIKNVIYPDGYERFSPEDTVFRILLFKLFNKIETWELFKENVGEILYNNYSYENYSWVLSDAFQNNTKIYSAAYIMPSAKNVFHQERKHQNHLKLLEFIMRDKLPKKIAKAKTLKELFEVLVAYPSIGDFLAFQYAIDINYSELSDYSEMSYVVAGPGAKRGIGKCFESTGKYTEYDVIKMMADHQQSEFARLNLHFTPLGGKRNLQLIDCQNLFCETDKYTRVAFASEIMTDSHKRIKQLYKSRYTEPIRFFYPPKWEINDIY